MALTERQLERRRKSLGGSDIAVLLGHSRKSEYDLWLEKKHGVVTFEGNDATEFGNVVEPAITDWAAEKLGVRVRKNVFRSTPDAPFHANLDAMVVGKPEAIEVKFTGYKIDELWGDPGTDDIPHPFVCQCQWQMGIAGLERVHVAAGLTPSFGMNRLRLYGVGAHQELQHRMIDIGRGWWDRYIIGEDVPTDLPSDAAIKSIERVPNLEVSIDRDLVAELIQAKSEMKDAKALVKELTQELHKALYEPASGKWAERGVIPGCEFPVTYFEHQRKAYEVKSATFRRLQLPKEL